MSGLILINWIVWIIYCNVCCPQTLQYFLFVPNTRGQKIHEAQYLIYSCRVTTYSPSAVDWVTISLSTMGRCLDIGWKNNQKYSSFHRKSTRITTNNITFIKNVGVTIWPNIHVDKCTEVYRILQNIERKEYHYLRICWASTLNLHLLTFTAFK